MTHLNLISFVCLLIFIYYIKVMLNKPEKIRNTFLNIQLAIILIYNVVIIIIFPYKVPVEFSTISYFVVPFIAILNIKELKLWAAYSALLSGAGYYISMLISGNALYSHFPVYSVVTSLFNHGSLFAFAIITIAHHEITKKDKYILSIGLLINSGWALLLRPFVLHPGIIFIYEILDGSAGRFFFPNNTVLGLVMYWLTVPVIVYLSLKIVYLMNHLFKNKIKTVEVNEQYNLA